MKTKLTLTALLFIFLTACTMGATPAPTADVNAINTAAVGTAMAQLSVQFTQTALAAPSATSMPTNTAQSVTTLSTADGAAPTTSGALPTVSFNNTPNATLLPGFTPLASPVPPSGPTSSLGDDCNNNVYEGDVTIPDGTIMKPGVDFIKTWAIRNTGSCTWDEGYTLVFVGGDRAMDPIDIEFKKTSDFVDPGEGVNISVPLTAPLKEGKYIGTWKMRTDSGVYFGTPLTVDFEVQK
jgi:hypothetical protein